MHGAPLCSPADVEPCLRLYASLLQTSQSVCWLQCYTKSSCKDFWQQKYILVFICKTTMLELF